MDIVSRIKFFLDTYNIANSQFADKCDIPRPTISQLLKGRNKKVSDEVISKIHAAYPELSIMWLMFGEEPMMLAPMKKNTDAPSRSEAQALFTDDEKLDENEIFTKKEDNRIIFANNNEIETDTNDLESNSSDTLSLSQTLENLAKNVGKSRMSNNSDGLMSGKHIVNVMVFYSDNSFESFKPSR